jgi:hypothetical protein
VKFVLLVPVPFALAMLIEPVIAPSGTVAVIDVAETTVKLAASVPLNWTAVVPVKLVPVIYTVIPTVPRAGKKLVIAGMGMTVKLVLLIAVPPGVMTPIAPVVALAGTMAVIDVLDTTV